MISAKHVLRSPSGALTFVNERRADYLGLPKGRPLGCARKGDRRECLRASCGVCSRSRGRLRDSESRGQGSKRGSRAEDQESLSFAGVEAFLTGGCLDFRHCPDLAGLASAYARENWVAFNWTGSCVTRDRGVAEDSSQEGPGPRVHGQRSTRR